MKKYIGLLFFINLSISHIYSQKTTIKDVLSTAVKDDRLQQNLHIKSFTQGLTFHVPIVKQIDGRIGFNGNALGDTIYGYLRNEDVYGLQFGFNSFREIKQQKLLKQAQLDLYDSETRVLEQQALFDRYQSLINLTFNQKLLAKRQQVESLLIKKHNILSLMIEKGLDVMIKYVMDAEDDKNNVQLVILDLENDIRFQQNKIKQFMKSDSISDINVAGFINILKIEEIVNNQKIIQSYHPSLNYKNVKTDLCTANLKYINTQNRQIFNSINLGYQNPLYLERPKKFNTLNNMSIRIGLSLPLIGNNNFKMAKALLEQQDAKNEADWLLQQLMRNIENQYLKIENLMKQYKLCNEKIEKSLIQKMLKNEKLIAQMTALELVDLQLTQQKLELRSIDLAFDITSEFIKLLDMNGKLSERPFKNYISANLDNF